MRREGRGQSLQERPGPISEAGSHSNINSTVDRFAQITDDKGVELRLNYNGVENIPMWAIGPEVPATAAEAPAEAGSGTTEASTTAGAGTPAAEPTQCE
jgi:hypothetical protein